MNTVIEPTPQPGTLSVQRRLLSYILAGALAFALVGAAIVYKSSQTRAQATARDALGSLVDSVEKTAAIGAFAADQVLLQELVDGLARHPLVAQASALGKDGARLAERQSAQLRGASGETAIAGGDVGLRVERALLSPFDTAEQVGTLLVLADDARVAAMARSEAVRISVFLLLQTLLVALMLYAVARALVSRPLLELATRLRALEPGSADRVARMPGHEHDEIGSLVYSANELLDQTQAAMFRERRARAEIEATEAQYRQMFESSSAGILVIDFQGSLLHCNATAQRLAGWTNAQMNEMKRIDVMEALFEQPERIKALADQAAATRELLAADFELKRVDSTSRWVHCLVSASEIASEHRVVEAVLYDITERRKREAAIRYKAEHDNLTGLRNRATMEAAIDRHVEMGLAGDMPLWTVMGIDLDGFKQVNDRLGHAAGDRVLVEVARRMRAAVRRSTDTVGRIGGDEFLVLLGQIDAADESASNIAANLIASLSEPIELDDGQQVRVGASVGMASFPRHGQTRKQLLHAADIAMYEVKRTGKNAYALALGAPSDF